MTKKRTHIWISGHHFPPSPPVNRAYCGRRFVGTVTSFAAPDDAATCPKCLDEYGRDAFEEYAAEEAAEVPGSGARADRLEQAYIESMTPLSGHAGKTTGERR